MLPLLYCNTSFKLKTMLNLDNTQECRSYNNESDELYLAMHFLYCYL